MRLVSTLTCCLIVPIFSGMAPAAEPVGLPSWLKPYGIEQRPLWTTSRVVGSPNPPLPFRVAQTFTKVKIVCPIAVAHEPGTDALLVIHQHQAWSGSGRVLRLKDDAQVDKFEVLLEMDRIAYGLAFHPDYLKNGYLYVGSNGPVKGKPKKTSVVRYTVEREPPHRIVPKSEKLIIEWESDGHNGGDLAFGRDGMLYVTSGDGTSDSDTNLTGQDLTKLLAKVLRIDVDRPDLDKGYAVPADNPFVGQKDIRPETWAYGFRNPWRITVDRKTGDVWVGQNGQDLWEQAFLVQRGANYGWSVTEGSHPFYPNRKAGPHPIQKPTVEHPHSEFRSLTGGVVYHGKQFPELAGAYIYGDWSTGKIWGVRVEGGKVVWNKELADTILQITGLGIDSKGEVLVADHVGGIYRLEAMPPEKSPHKFPTRLSDTGVFASVKDHRPDPGLIPYSVNAQLWSDGAEKERFIGLPGTGQIDFTTSRGWNFPDGTVLVKTFSLDLEAGKPASRRRIETRLLTRQQGKWVGYSYVWNDEQSDAELVPAAGVDRAYEIRDPQAPEGRRQQKWHYPSRTECMVCHSRAANFVLGLTELQMNKEHDYGKVTDNQLRTLEHLGVFKVPTGEHVQESRERLQRFSDGTRYYARLPFDGLLGELLQPPKLATDLLAPTVRSLAAPLTVVQKEAQRTVAKLEQLAQNRRPLSTLLPKRPEQYRRLVNPYDARADLDARARSYVHANCAQCHVEAGGGNAQMQLEFTTARDKMGVFDVKPLHHTYGIADAGLVVPGAPERSLLYLRVARRGEGQMPPLATSEVDREAVRLLHDWIKQLKPAAAKPPGKE